MRKIDTIDIEEIVSIVAGSDGDLNLAAERLAKRDGGNFNDVKEDELKARIANMDIQSSDMLASRFRTLLTIKLYNMITLAMNQLMFDIGELKPADLAKTTTSMMGAFATLTAPATKVTFDFEAELQKLSEEFDVPIEDMRGEIKEMEAKVKSSSSKIVGLGKGRVR